MKLRSKPVALLFVLVLALASVTMSVARGQAVAVGTGMFCSGQGMVLRAVDAHGQPTLALHVCPDCQAGFGPALLTAPVATPEAPTRICFDPPPRLASAPAKAAPQPQARGPPRMA